MNSKKLLIVEDDVALGLLLLDHLVSEQYQVVWKRDGLAALEVLNKQQFDMCLLDISMPGMDGFSLSKQIKKKYTSLPFIFITARALKEDKLKAYELGAEDFVTKPFDPDELICKIEVVLRRSPAFPKPYLKDEISLGKYVYFTQRQELVYQSERIKLTAKENQILLLFCNQPNVVIRREDAVEKVYGKYDYFLGRSFDVFVSRLRKILKDEDDVQIENVFKVGFIFRMKETEAIV